jgi:hypothetical protein
MIGAATNMKHALCCAGPLAEEFTRAADSDLRRRHVALANTTTSTSVDTLLMGSSEFALSRRSRRIELGYQEAIKKFRYHQKSVNGHDVILTISHF